MGQMRGVRYTPDVRDAETWCMWWTARSAASAAAVMTVLGAGLVTASLHGHGSPAAATARMVLIAPETYQPPHVPLPTPAADVKVLPRAARRPTAHDRARTTQP